jgi:hypothetical protein
MRNSPKFADNERGILRGEIKMDLSLGPSFNILRNSMLERRIPLIFNMVIISGSIKCKTIVPGYTAKLFKAIF